MTGRTAPVKWSENDMRWIVSWGLLTFAASVMMIIGLAAHPAQAGDRESVSATFGTTSGGFWHDPQFYDRSQGRDHNQRRRKHRRHHRRNAFFPAPWPAPWPGPPQVIYVERPQIAPLPSPLPLPISPKPYCREFQKQIIIDGRTEQAYGVACRQPDGIWKLQP